MADYTNLELSESLEDYLEVIYRIESEKHVARAKDVAEMLGVGRSSVTGAMRALAERELVNYAPYNLITLTDKGRAIAEEVDRRHELLLEFFSKVLSLDRDAAEKIACRLEHSIPGDLLERFSEFLDFVDNCENGSVRWHEGAGFFREKVGDGGGCERCEKLSRGLREGK